MRKQLLLLFTILCGIATATNAYAQDKEFWFVAPESWASAPAFMMLSNPGLTPATVTIEVYGGSAVPTVIPVTILPGDYHREVWATTTGIGNPVGSAGTITNYGIHVISDVPLTGYWMANYNDLKDFYTFKGDAALGTDFYVPFQHDHYQRENVASRPEELDIVATENGTDITFTPNVDCINTGGATYLAGTTYTITGLNKGQTFKLAATSINSANSLSGSHVTSTKPVALTITTVNTAGSPTAGAGDTVGDQIVPVNNVGKRYVVIKGFSADYGNTPSDRVYFTGTEAGTTITIYYEVGGVTNTQTLTANAGQTVVFDMGNNVNVGGVFTPNDPAAIYVQADKPVYCFHHSAVQREVGGALISSLYSIGQKSLSFYQLGSADNIDQSFAFLVFRDTCENYFTIDYGGSTYPLTVVPNDIPNESGWKWARVNLPTAANNSFVTVKNSESAFSLGYFAYAITGIGTACYGYVSGFGNFQFDPDTNWRCSESTPVTLLGGYALTYKWTLPDGSIKTTPTINAREDGMYILEMDQDPRIVTDTCWVQTIHFEAEMTRMPNKPAKVGVPQSFGTTVRLSMASMLAYDWTFEGATPSSSSSPAPKVIWNTTGQKKVTLHLSATAGTGRHTVVCDTTMVLDFLVHEKNLGYFVNEAQVDGNHDGSSWENAFQEVYQALDSASQGDCIWVAEGTYQPKADGKSFIMDYDSVEMYGGFGGWEADLSERDYTRHQTILEGRDSSVVIFDGSNGYTSGSCGVSRATRLDGFTVYGGAGDNGAGILFRGGASGTVAYCTIKGNTAKADGGGIYIGGTYSGCVVGSGDPLLVNNEVSGNRAASGAGIYNNGSKFLSVNNTIAGNASKIASGLYNEGDADLRNTIIWGNLTDGALGTDVTNGSGTPVYSYCDIAGWSTALGQDGTHNIDKNPIFQRKGYTDDLTLRQGVYKISNASPAVDNGRNAYVMGDLTNRKTTTLLHPSTATYSEALALDLAAMERINNDIVDMGAFEFHPDTAYPQLVHEVVIGTYPNMTTNPAAGIHQVIAHDNFTMTLTPDAGYSLNYITITTGSDLQDNQGGMIVTHNPDGTVTVIFKEVSDPLDVKISGISPTANMSIENGYAIYAKGGNLYVQVAKPQMLNIYTVTGQLYRQQTVGAGETVIPLAQGVYVVTLDNGTKQKIVIK